MKFRIKNGIDLAGLRSFGFELGSVLIKQFPYSEAIFSYQHDWWFVIDFYKDEEDNPREHEESGWHPKARCWVDTRDNANLLWFDVEPECSYHMGMDDLHTVVDVVFQLTQAGLLEKIEGNELLRDE